MTKQEIDDREIEIRNGKRDMAWFYVLIIAVVALFFVAGFLTGCSTRKSLHGYVMTPRRCSLDSTLRYYRWVGVDRRPGKWVKEDSGTIVGYGEFIKFKK